MAKSKEHWLHKKYDVEGWVHDTFSFKNDGEYMIFLIWAVFVTTFLLTIR